MTLTPFDFAAYLPRPLLELPDQWQQHWPAIRYRLIGGYNAVITVIAVIAVAANLAWAGFQFIRPRLAALLVRLAQALDWLSVQLAATGDIDLSDSQPIEPAVDPALEPLSALIFGMGFEDLGGYTIPAGVVEAAAQAPVPAAPAKPAPRTRKRRGTPRPDARPA